MSENVNEVKEQTQEDINKLEKAKLDKLNEMYKKNPEKVTKEVRASMDRLSGKKRLIKEEHAETFYMIIIFIVIALLGLFNIGFYPLYLFGEV